MALPAVIAAMALDPAIDFADLGVDGASLLMQFAIYKQNTETQAVLCFEALMNIFQVVDGIVEDIEDDTEIAKLQMALFNPKILNKLLGDALNFGRPTKDVVEWHESTGDWDVPAWVS